MSEYDDKLNQEAAPQPRDPQTPPDPDPVPRPRKVRRVGTFTFGLVLVAAGASSPVWRRWCSSRWASRC